MLRLGTHTPRPNRPAAPTHRLPYGQLPSRVQLMHGTTLREGKKAEGRGGSGGCDGSLAGVGAAEEREVVVASTTQPSLHVRPRRATRHPPVRGRGGDYAVARALLERNLGQFGSGVCVRAAAGRRGARPLRGNELAHLGAPQDLRARRLARDSHLRKSRDKVGAFGSAELRSAHELRTKTDTPNSAQPTAAEQVQYPLQRRESYSPRIRKDLVPPTSDHSCLRRPAPPPANRRSAGT